MFDEKEISIFRIYCQLTEKMDILFIALAIIGSLGSGLSLPIIAYISSDLMGVGNTSEYADDPLILEKMRIHIFYIKWIWFIHIIFIITIKISTINIMHSFSL